MFAPHAIAINACPFDPSARRSASGRRWRRSSGLGTARVAEHILDRRTRGIGVDPQDLVDVALHESKRLVTDLTHRGVTEQLDVVEFDDLTCTDTSAIASESSV